MNNNSLFYRKPDSPCKGCTDRFLGCHGTCEDYAAWSKEEKEIGDKIKEERHTEFMKCEPEIRGYIKRKKGYLK